MAIQYKDAPVRKDENMTVLVYGTWGSGKSRFASSFPQPFFIVTDGNNMAVKGPYADVARFDEILEVLSDASAGRGPFASIRTLVLDGLTEISPMVIEAVAGPGGKMDLQKWGAAGDRLRMLLRQLLGLRSRFHIVVTAKAGTDKDDLTGEVWGYPDTIGKLRNVVGGMFQMVFYAENTLAYDEAAKGMRPKWLLHTVKKGFYPAVDRTGMLGVTEPNDFTVIQSKILGGSK